MSDGWVRPTRSGRPSASGACSLVTMTRRWLASSIEQRLGVVRSVGVDVLQYLELGDRRERPGVGFGEPVHAHRPTIGAVVADVCEVEHLGVAVLGDGDVLQIGHAVDVEGVEADVEAIGSDREHTRVVATVVVGPEHTRMCSARHQAGRLDELVVVDGSPVLGAGSRTERCGQFGRTRP